MINLYLKDTHDLVGTITEDELQFLIGELEEEYPEDRDYAFTRMTVEYLQGDGADPALLALLNRLLPSDADENFEVILIWERVGASSVD